MTTDLAGREAADLAVTPPPVPLRWQVLCPLLGVAGGVLSILVAAARESGYGGYFAILVAAPIVEEGVKPLGVYVLLVKWPQTLRNRQYTAYLAALGGLAFAVVENTLYLEVYAPDHNLALVLWRYGVNLPLHMAGSYVVGLGINRKVLGAMRGESRFLSADWKFFLIPMAAHAAYNLLAVFVIQDMFDWGVD